MNKIIDARGLSCPQPVIMAARALSDGVFPFDLIVDNVTSCENCKRFLLTKHLKVSITQQEDDITLHVESHA